MKGEQIIINAHAHSVNYTQCVALSADGRLYGGEVATTLLLLHAIDGTHTARIYECGGEKCMNYLVGITPIKRQPQVMNESGEGEQEEANEHQTIIRVHTRVCPTTASQLLSMALICHHTTNNWISRRCRRPLTQAQLAWHFKSKSVTVTLNGGWWLGEGKSINCHFGEELGQSLFRGSWKSFEETVEC